MKTIAHINQKGGQGKSSTVFSVGGALAKLGYRTLVVDCDQQASASQGFLSPDVASRLSPRDTVAGLYEADGMTDLGNIILPIRDNLGLAPGHIRMQAFNIPDPWDAGPDQFILRDSLAEVSDRFDIALIDCPPHIQMHGWASLVAADGAVIPAEMEDPAVIGLSAMLGWIDQARDMANPRLRLLGILATRYEPDRYTVHRDYYRDMVAAHGDDVFRATFAASAHVKNAWTARKSVVDYRPNTDAARGVMAIAKELVERIEERCGPILPATAKEVA